MCSSDLAAPTLNTQNEDCGTPVGAVGTLVTTLVDYAGESGTLNNVLDPDGITSLGIAVVAADTANGTWFYSTDNGVTWSGLGSVSAANSRLLAADANTRIYFQPVANFNGTLNNAITFRAWDRSSGANGGLANTSTSGGTTAFSIATDSASLVIQSVNDTPVIVSDGGLTTVNKSIAENATFVTQVVTNDVDGDSLVYSIFGGTDSDRKSTCLNSSH